MQRHRSGFAVALAVVLGGTTLAPVAAFAVAAPTSVHATNVPVVITDKSAAQGEPLHYSSPQNGTINVPVGTDEQADLLTATALDENGTITLSATTDKLVNPSTDAGWQTNTPALTNTYISWVLAPAGTASNPNDQYAVFYDTNYKIGGRSGALSAQLSLGAEGGDQAVEADCAVTPRYSAAAGYSASFSSACLSNPASFQFYAYLIYKPGNSATYLVGKTAPYTKSGVTSPIPPFAPLPVESPGPAPKVAPGYWLFASDGGVFTFGSAPFLGSTGNITLTKPIVQGVATADGKGYLMVASDGGVFTFGDAVFRGSAGSLRLNAPVVGMATSGNGAGYWLVASDGGIFEYGRAPFYGSEGGTHLNQPIVGIAEDPATGGYWLVARDGGVFAFNAPFYGSEGGTRLNQPIVGIEATPDGKGYWMVASDGGVFAFGDAAFHGSTGGVHLNKPIVGIAPDTGAGYWLAASDGGIFAFDAPFLGSTGGITLNKPVVSFAAQG